MPDVQFPRRIAKLKPRKQSNTCPAHRAWVRKHSCSVPGCARMPIEAAHVRKDTHAGLSLKPSDRWVISLCAHHHREQHNVGERAFERRYSIDLAALAQEFARRSPHHTKLLRSGL
jgi:hypothetical protein